MKITVCYCLHKFFFMFLHFVCFPHWCSILLDFTCKESNNFVFVNNDSRATAGDWMSLNRFLLPFQISFYVKFARKLADSSRLNTAVWQEAVCCLLCEWKRTVRTCLLCFGSPSWWQSQSSCFLLRGARRDLWGAMTKYTWEQPAQTSLTDWWSPLFWISVFSWILLRIVQIWHITSL